jgi:hypothetical protein
MSSSIPIFKAALLERLKNEPGFSDVQVSWGHPYPTRLSDELIIIGNVTASPGQNEVGFASGDREEQYHLSVLVSVAKSARIRQQMLEERAFALVAVIERSMIMWRFEAVPFGGIDGWVQVASMGSDEIVSETGDSREASVTVTIAVTARIREEL